jgi:hypothetical protein
VSRVVDQKIFMGYALQFSLSMAQRDQVWQWPEAYHRNFDSSSHNSSLFDLVIFDL